MRLVWKNLAVLFIAYAILIGGLTLWLGNSRIRTESELIEASLTLLGQEKAAALDETIRATLDPTNLLGDTRLRHEIEAVLESSELVTSITVVEPSGKVVASDFYPAGSRLMSAQLVFSGMEAPQPYAKALEGSMREAQYVLYLPLSSFPGSLRGYLQIHFQSPRVKQYAKTLNDRLLSEAIVGIALVAITGITLHLQLSRQARRLTRYLEDIESDAKSRAPSPRPDRGDEFSTVYQAAAKVGSALAQARQRGAGAERRVGQMSEVLHVGLVWCQPDKQVEFTNRRALDLVGAASLEEFREQWNLVAAPVHGAMDQMTKSDSPRSDPIEVMIGNPLRTIRILVYRIGASECEGFAAILTDPGIIESLEEDVGLAGQMKSLSRVLKTVVHELRSPLGALIVNIDLLRESLGESAEQDARSQKEQHRFVGIIQSEMQRLNQTLLEMLTQVAPFSKPPERVALEVLLQDLVLLLKEQARRQGVEIRPRIPRERVQVMGKADHLRQAFLNVSVNALEAMRKGGTLAIELTTNSTTAEILFCDTGPGLPEAIRDRIFEMGYTTKDAGSGMGLHVARTLLEQHGGTIGAEPESAGGTRFRITLPVVASDTAA